MLFEIPMKPKPLQRTRTRKGGGKVYETKAQKEYKQTAELFVISAMNNLGVKIFSEPVGVELNFYNKNKARGDIDNYVKMYLDIMNKLVYEDDKQVYSLVANKFEDCDEDKIVISVYSL